MAGRAPDLHRDRDGRATRDGRRLVSRGAPCRGRRPRRRVAGVGRRAPFAALRRRPRRRGSRLRRLGSPALPDRARPCAPARPCRDHAARRCGNRGRDRRSRRLCARLGECKRSFDGRHRRVRAARARARDVRRGGRRGAPAAPDAPGARAPRPPRARRAAAGGALARTQSGRRRRDRDLPRCEPRARDLRHDLPFDARDRPARRSRLRRTGALRGRREPRRARPRPARLERRPCDPAHPALGERACGGRFHVPRDALVGATGHRRLAFGLRLAIAARAREGNPARVPDRSSFDEAPFRQPVHAARLEPRRPDRDPRLLPLAARRLRRSDARGDAGGTHHRAPRPHPVRRGDADLAAVLSPERRSGRLERADGNPAFGPGSAHPRHAARGRHPRASAVRGLDRG